MRWIKSIEAIVGMVVASAVLTGSPAAAELPVGPPINVSKPFTIDTGSYEILPLSTPDPSGGLPWGLATYAAELRGRHQLVCNDVGRLQGGRLGIVTAENIFRPYEPGGALDSRCGGVDPHTRNSGYMIRVVPARLPSGCDVSNAPTAPVRCHDAGGPFRTLFVGTLGRGIISAQTTIGGRVQRLPITPEGELLAVFNGTFTDATIPSIQLTVSTCGADARLDLSGRRMTATGCRATLEFPTDPRPARESAASRRARRAARVSAPLRVIERPGSASTRRFTSRLTVPITVRDVAEGYAYQLSGPSGRRCSSRATARPGTNYFSSYLQIEGKTYDLPIMPLSGTWCPGRYTLTMYFVRKTGPKPTQLTRKQIASKTFNVRNGG